MSYIDEVKKIMAMKFSLKKYGVLLVSIIFIFTMAACGSSGRRIIFGNEYNSEKNTFKMVYDTLPSDKEVSALYKNNEPIGTESIGLRIYTGNKEDNFVLGGSNRTVKKTDSSVIIPLPMLETGKYYIEIYSGDKVLIGKSIEVYGKGTVEDKK